MSEPKNNLDENETKLAKGSEKVRQAIEKIEKERTEKGADPEVIKQKEGKIRKAEEKLNELE